VENRGHYKSSSIALSEPRWPAALEIAKGFAETPEPDGAAEVEIPELTLWNGRGGFTPDGREYVIVLNGADETPLPWANVLANPRFGSVVTASGPSYTWAENSRETGSPRLPTIR